MKSNAEIDAEVEATLVKLYGGSWFHIMNPRTYEVRVLDIENNRLIMLGEVTVTEKMYREAQAKLTGTQAQINYLPKHCAQQLAKRTFLRDDVHVKMV